MWEQALPLLIIFSSINQSFSGTLWYLEDKTAPDVYKNSRKTNLYRGILFSYSAAQKKKLCEDYYSNQLYTVTRVEDIEGDVDAKILVTDLNGAEEKPQFPLIVKHIFIDGTTKETSLRTLDLFCTCVGRKFETTTRKPIHERFDMSGAFKSGYWYVSTWHDIDDDELSSMVPIFYMASSPEFVQLEQKQVEEKYMKVRQRIEALRKESAKYIQLVEERDNLSALSKDQKLHLCNSILSTDTYRVDRFEYDPNWIAKNPNDLKYERKPLTFTNSDYTVELLEADGIFCMGYKDREAMYKLPAVLFFTRSYDDNDSLYVIKQQLRGGEIFFSKYFRKIPTLTNALMPMTGINLTVNY